MDATALNFHDNSGGREDQSGMMNYNIITGSFTNTDYGELPCLEDSTATDKSDSVGTSPSTGNEMTVQRSWTATEKSGNIITNASLGNKFSAEKVSMPVTTNRAVGKKTRKTAALLECDECKATFRLPQDLIKHKKLHAGEQLYQCHICGRMYTRRDNMRLHMRIHVKERPFSCTQCGETFRYRPNLTRHKHIKHGLPKAYSLSPSRSATSRERIERSILTGLLPNYNVYAQRGATDMQGMTSMIDTMQSTSQSSSTSALLDSVHFRPTVSQPSNSPTGGIPQHVANNQSMPVIGQVYSLSETQQQQSPATTVTSAIVSTATTASKFSVRSDLNHLIKSGHHQGKPMSSNSRSSESVPFSHNQNAFERRNPETESSGSGGEGADAFTVHWKRVENRGTTQEGLIQQNLESDTNTTSWCVTGEVPTKNSSPAVAHNYITSSTNQSLNSEQIVTEFSNTDKSDNKPINTSIKEEDRDEEEITMVTASTHDEPSERDEQRGQDKSPSRLTIPRINLKIGDRNLASSVSRRKQMLPLRLSMGKPSTGIAKAMPFRHENTGDLNRPVSLDETAEAGADAACESCDRFREFLCQHCEISFPDLSTFMIHRGCHGRDSPFQCNACGYCCKDRVEFNAHIIKGHFM
ncbi:uncharacterized protein LOC144452657 [Glandiceps talaboti]